MASAEWCSAMRATLSLSDASATGGLCRVDEAMAMFDKYDRRQA